MTFLLKKTLHTHTILHTPFANIYVTKIIEQGDDRRRITYFHVISVSNIINVCGVIFTYIKERKNMFGIWHQRQQCLYVPRRGDEALPR